MKKRRFLLHIAGLLLALILLPGMNSCGTTRAHFDLDHDVAYNWNEGRFEDGAPHHKHHHKKNKPPKHKKQAPPKHKKHHH